MKKYLLLIISLFSTVSLCADLPKITNYTIENSDGSRSRVQEIDNSNEITEKYCPGLPKKEIRVYNSDGSWSKIKK